MKSDNNTKWECQTEECTHIMTPLNKTIKNATDVQWQEIDNWLLVEAGDAIKINRRYVTKLVAHDAFYLKDMVSRRENIWNKYRGNSRVFFCLNKLFWNFPQFLWHKLSYVKETFIYRNLFGYTNNVIAIHMLILCFYILW